MYTTVAWYEVAAKTLAALNAVADEHVTIVADDITIPIDLDQVIGIQITGDAVSRARLSSPSLRRIWLEELSPITNPAALAPEPNRVGLIKRFDSPLPLVASEKLNAVVTCTTSACVVAFLGDGPIAPVEGDIRTMRATAAIVGVAGSWESGVLTFSQTLPAGRYQVVGMRCIYNHGIAARLLFVGQWARPGCVCTPERAGENDEPFRMGTPGVLGEFEFDQPPQMEVLAFNTDAVQEVYLDLIQIREGRS